MPAEDFLKATEQIARKTDPSGITVVLTGGEPLLRPDIAETGRRLRQQGFRWSLVTNGYLLDSSRLNSLLNAGLGAITISLDGLPADHNWLRNHPESYNRAIEAIRLAASHRRLQADVVTCVNHRNIGSLPEIHTILAGTGIRKWRLFTITPIGRAAGNEDLLLSGTEVSRMLDFITKARTGGIKPEPSFSCESYLGSFEGRARDGFFFCRAGIHIGSILADGGISACPNIDRTLVQGNIYSDEFMQVWEERFLPFRNREWTRTGACAKCSEYRYCGGNGLHWWDYEKKEMPGCNCKKADASAV
jgi:radical SAM protein with 4Fe4S-binding SPASM domain